MASCSKTERVGVGGSSVGSIRDDGGSSGQETGPIRLVNKPACVVSQSPVSCRWALSVIDWHAGEPNGYQRAALALCTTGDAGCQEPRVNGRAYAICLRVLVMLSTTLPLLGSSQCPDSLSQSSLGPITNGLRAEYQRRVQKGICSVNALQEGT